MEYAQVHLSEHNNEWNKFALSVAQEIRQRMSSSSVDEKTGNRNNTQNSSANNARIQPAKQ